VTEPGQPWWWSSSPVAPAEAPRPSRSGPADPEPAGAPPAEPRVGGWPTGGSAAARASAVRSRAPLGSGHNGAVSPPPAPELQATPRPAAAVGPHAPDDERFAGFGPPRRAVFADRHGLTGLGAVLLSLAFSVAGAIFDALRAPSSDTAPLHVAFVAFFAVGSLLAVLAVHRSRVSVAMTAPPLVYLVAAVVAGLIYADRNGFSLVGKDAGTSAAAALFNLAPELVGVTVLTLAIGWLRRGSRRSR
jgi:hypothetical protein